MLKIHVICVVLVVLALHDQCDGGEPLWSNGWKKSTENPVLALSPAGKFDSQNIFAPAIAKHNGVYYLYYSGGPSGPLTGEEFINYQLGLATSTDGVHFTKRDEPLLSLGMRDNFHATPTLLRDPQGNLLLDEHGTWHLFFNGNRADDVEHATSQDGIKWKRDSRSPIYRNAYAPNVLKVGNEYRMYHIHKPPTGNWEVHLATGPDMHSLRSHPKNPVLTVSQGWEAKHLVYPYVLRENDTWVAFYAAYWNSPDGGQKTAIGTATSRDGVQWTKYEDNPVLTPIPNSPHESVYNSSQAVFRDGDSYRLFYASRIDTIHKYFSINLATKPASD
jgi:sucrose-6-phosphate hydrolase SacC (GH32 family)